MKLELVSAIECPDDVLLVETLYTADPDQQAVAEAAQALAKTNLALAKATDPAARANLQAVLIAYKANLDAEQRGKQTTLAAHGWVSALTNHFDPGAYNEDGHRKDDAKSRRMTNEEVRVYCAQLVRNAYPQLFAEKKDLLA